MFKCVLSKIIFLLNNYIFIKLYFLMFSKKSKLTQK
nr:MAG TPA: hypothetical protein [Caudoviricetes sp.]